MAYACFVIVYMLGASAVSQARNLDIEVEEPIEVLRGEQGHPVDIPCDLIVEDHVVIVWKQHRRILFAGPLRVRQDSRLSVHRGFMRIDGVLPDDNGDYSCQAELPTGELLVSKKQLVVLQPAAAKITPGGGVITVKSGTSLVLSCTGSGVPAPQVSWLREGKVVASGEGEADLPLKGIEWQSGGDYQCRAANGVGEPNIQNYTIHVLHAPIVEVLPAEVEVDATSCHVQIQCLVYSAPKSTVSWYHQGRLIKAGGGDDVTLWTLEYLHVLQLNDCVARAGDYTCVAENSLGRAEGHTSLQEHMMKVEEVVAVRVDRQISVNSGSTASSTSSLLSLVSCTATALVLSLLRR